MPLRTSFTAQLKELDEALLRMGSLVDEAIKLSLDALVTRDSDLAARVILGDGEINILRYDIEEKAYMLFATQAPLARDLRRITSAISIGTNMERIADHAAGIAVLARRLNREPQLKPFVDVPRMSEKARAMLRRSLDAYVKGDAVLAREVAAQDEEINELYDQLLRELLTFMIEDPQTIRRATYLLWVAHNLERIGDRTKNICERVVYVATGELADFDVHVDTEQGLDEHDALGGIPI